VFSKEVIEVLEETVRMVKIEKGKTKVPEKRSAC